MIFKDQLYVVNPRFGFSQRTLVERFANSNSLGGRLSSLGAVVAKNDGLSAAQVEEISVRTFLQKAGLCQKDARCSSVGCARRWMKIGWVDGNRFAFVCSKCNANKSMFLGTFLEGHQLDNWKFVFIFGEMCNWRQYTQRAIAERLELDKNTVSQWAIWIREAFAVFNKRQMIKLGGPNKIVYIDEVR